MLGKLFKNINIR